MSSNYLLNIYQNNATVRCNHFNRSDIFYSEMHCELNVIHVYFLFLTTIISRAYPCLYFIDALLQQLLTYFQIACRSTPFQIQSYKAFSLSLCRRVSRWSWSNWGVCHVMLQSWHTMGSLLVALQKVDMMLNEVVEKMFHSRKIWSCRR